VKQILRGRLFHAVFVKMSEVTRKKPGANAGSRASDLEERFCEDRKQSFLLAKLMRTQNEKKLCETVIGEV